jgi:hypothetical protein
VTVTNREADNCDLIEVQLPRAGQEVLLAGEWNMKAARRIISSTWFIHLMVPLGLSALWGSIELDNEYLLLCVFLSFSGATCGSFIRVVDAIRSEK